MRKLLCLLPLLLAVPSYAGIACTPHACAINYATHTYFCQTWGSGYCGCTITQGGQTCNAYGICGVNHICQIGGASMQADVVTEFPWVSDDDAIYAAVKKSHLAGTKRIVDNVRVNLLTGKGPIMHNSGVFVLVNDQEYFGRVRLAGNVVTIQLYAPGVDHNQTPTETLVFEPTKWTHKGTGLPESTGKVAKPIKVKKNACMGIAEGEHKLGQGF